MSLHPIPVIGVGVTEWISRTAYSPRQKRGEYKDTNGCSAIICVDALYSRSQSYTLLRPDKQFARLDLQSPSSLLESHLPAIQCSARPL